MFCLPGDNGHFPIVHEHAASAGYVANLTIYDRINTIDSDLTGSGSRPAAHGIPAAVLFGLRSL